jgi:hypothetical protein
LGRAAARVTFDKIKVPFSRNELVAVRNNGSQAPIPYKTSVARTMSKAWLLLLGVVVDDDSRAAAP